MLSPLQRELGNIEVRFITMTYPCCSSRTQLRRCCGLLTLALTLFNASSACTSMWDPCLDQGPPTPPTTFLLLQAVSQVSMHSGRLEHPVPETDNIIKSKQ